MINLGLSFQRKGPTAPAVQEVIPEVEPKDKPEALINQYEKPTVELRVSSSSNIFLKFRCGGVKGDLQKNGKTTDVDVDFRAIPQIIENNSIKKFTLAPTSEVKLSDLKKLNTESWILPYQAIAKDRDSGEPVVYHGGYFIIHAVDGPTERRVNIINGQKLDSEKTVRIAR
jgi:hypothetical protein